VVVEIQENQEEIYDYLRQECGYSFFIGMDNEVVSGDPWPANLIASVHPVQIPF
jgi:hypothetical protein